MAPFRYLTQSQKYFKGFLITSSAFSFMSNMVLVIFFLTMKYSMRNRTFQRQKHPNHSSHSYRGVRTVEHTNSTLLLLRECPLNWHDLLLWNNSLAMCLSMVSWISRIPFLCSEFSACVWWSQSHLFLWPAIRVWWRYLFVPRMTWAFHPSGVRFCKHVCNGDCRLGVGAALWLKNPNGSPSLTLSLWPQPCPACTGPIGTQSDLSLSQGALERRHEVVTPKHLGQIHHDA